VKPAVAKPDYHLLAGTVLRANEFFRECPSETLERIVAAGRIVLLEDGQCVHARGQTVDSLIVVVTGCLAVSTTSAAGKRHVVGLLQPGQVSALISFFDGKPSIHDNHAHGPTMVLRIDQQAVRQEMLQQPAMVNAMLRMLASRARGLHERAVSTLLEPLQVRVARVLLGLLGPYGLRRPSGILINLKLSQEDFASLLGVTRQRINREFNELVRRQVISVAYSQIHVVDLPQLHSIAGL